MTSIYQTRSHGLNSPSNGQGHENEVEHLHIFPWWRRKVFAFLEYLPVTKPSVIGQI